MCCVAQAACPAGCWYGLRSTSRHAALWCFWCGQLGLGEGGCPGARGLGRALPGATRGQQRQMPGREKVNTSVRFCASIRVSQLGQRPVCVLHASLQQVACRWAAGAAFSNCPHSETIPAVCPVQHALLIMTPPWGVASPLQGCVRYASGVAPAGLARDTHQCPTSVPRSGGCQAVTGLCQQKRDGCG